MLKRLLPATISTLNDDEVEVVMSTGAIARDGHILVPQGALLDNYRQNPVVLWQHDAKMPVARASDIRVAGNDISAKITFAPLGVSPDADKVRGLVKSGIVNAVSVGFDPIDGDPLDPRKPYSGKRFTEWELLECSFVSVPADTGAVVTAREHDPVVEVNPNSTTISRAAVLKRGLYEVSDLACLLASAGYLQMWVEMEAEMEGDGSDIPAKFAAALKQLGQVLLEMTVEELGEMFEGDDERARTIAVLKRGHAFVADAIRAGKKVSKATKAQIQEAIDHHERGLDCLRSMCRDDDEGGEMAHEPAAARDAGDGMPEKTTIIVPPERAAAIERLRQLKVRGELSRRQVAA